jgi:hypothetical protein
MILAMGTIGCSDRFLNLVDYADVKDEIGLAGAIELALLRYWLELDFWPQVDWKWHFKKTKEIRANDSYLNQWVWRMAPSIICRSEISLFNISMPRFAFRTYMADGSLFNIRRLATFSGQVRKWHNLDGRKVHRFLPKPALFLRQNKCVADCFLRSPSRTRGYHVLQVPLAKAYGEVYPDKEDVDGTPYMRHIQPGGGLCAQAVIYIASVLLPQCGKGIYGAAGVTAIGTAKEAGADSLERLELSPRLELSGLNDTEMATYFRRMGYTAIWQQPLPKQQPDGSISRVPSVRASKLDPLIISFRHALQSYLLSDIPVILPVDVGRLKGLNRTFLCSQIPVPQGSVSLSGSELRQPANAGEINAPPKVPDPLNFENSVFHSNGLGQNDPTVIDHRRNLGHVVVLVGCEHPVEEHNQDCGFLLQDPAHFPFMKASGLNILLAGCYDERADYVHFGAFLPVTPESIQMHLLPKWRTENPGLLSLATDILSLGKLITGDEKFIADYLGMFGIEAFHFRLIPFTQKSVSAALTLDFPRRSDLGAIPFSRDIEQKHFQVLRDKFLERIASFLKPSPPPWVWLQWCGMAIFVWDAHYPPPEGEYTLDQVKKHLLAAAWLSTDDKFDANESFSFWQAQLATDEPPRPRPPASPPRPNPAIKNVSLISSFSLGELREVAEQWPHSDIPCELYVFMQNDAKRLLPHWSDRFSYLASAFRKMRRTPITPVPKPCSTILDRMTLFVDKDDFILSVANDIEKTLSEKSIRIVSLASYLPGLAFGPKGKDGVNPAVSASRFLIKLAGCLRRKYPDLNTVQLVAGSLIQGVECCPKTSSSGFSRFAAVFSNLSATLFPSETRVNSSLQHYEFFAHCLSQEKAIENLVKSCEALRPDVQAAGVRVVFEHEPGVLYTLGTLPQLAKFCSRLSDANLSRWFGLNLNVAHWGFLSRFTPENTAELFNYCWHSHASSHGIGQFGDAPIDSGRGPCLRTPDEFRRWFDRLGWSVTPRSAEQIVSTSLVMNPLFSSFVSLELEACRHLDIVHKSLVNLHEILYMPLPKDFTEEK